MNPTKKHFQLGIPKYVTIETESNTFVVHPNKPVISAEKNRAEITENSGHEDIFLTSEDSVRFLKMRWDYKIPKKAKFLGDAWERGYGDLEWRGMVGSRFMPWYFLASLPKKNICFGVKTRPSAMCCWQADPEGVTLIMDVRCGGEGVALNGRTLHVAQVICMEMGGMSSFKAAQEFCREMCPDPIFPEFPVYGSNNWYYAYGKSSEQEILQDTDYVLQLTDGASNPPFMVIDDCWQEHHRLNEYNGGPWRKGNQKFPDMERLAKKLSEKGVRPGIWIRLLLNEDACIPNQWRLSHNGCLDPSHPDALEYIKNDVKRVCGWGYQLIKHDFSTYDLFGKWEFEMNPFVTEDGWHFYNKQKTSAEIVRQLYEGIYEASKPSNAIILGCNTIGHLGAGLMQMNRTGDDTSGLTWERTRRMGINTLAFRLPHHNTFYHVDADCVGIAGKIPWELNRQWADVIAQSGTPLFVSAKPNLLNAGQQKELHQIMLMASEQKCSKVPTDWQETDCPEVWEGDGSAVTYHWYEDEGAHLKSKTEKYAAYIPIA